MATPTRTRVTAEELLAMPDLGRYELVDGELLERNVSKRSSRISTRLLIFLGQFVEANRLGVVFQSDLGLQIFAQTSKVRFADGSFYGNGHEEIPDGDGFLHTAPDLVFEVVSPNDISEDVEKKVAEYLEVGVRMVWVIHPDVRSVYVLRPAGLEARISGDGVLSGMDVVPGFELPLATLFQFQP